MSKYILSKSSKEIKNLDKYLFSNYKLSGRVLLYENLGAKTSFVMTPQWCADYENEYLEDLGKKKNAKAEDYKFSSVKHNTGRGLIVAEIEIGEVYKILDTCDTQVKTLETEETIHDRNVSNYHNTKDLQKQGYTNQKYAYEIKNLTTLPKPRRLDEFYSVRQIEKYRIAVDRHLLEEDGEKRYFNNEKVIEEIKVAEKCTEGGYVDWLKQFPVSKVNGIVKVIDIEEG
jgi:hypothetical protein